MPRVSLESKHDEHTDLEALGPPLEPEDEDRPIPCWREITAIGLGALGLVLLMALVSCDPSDTAGQVIQGDGEPTSPSNWVGMPGAYIAYGAFAFFGWCAYLLPVPLFMLAWQRWRSRLGTDENGPITWAEYLGVTMVLFGSAAGLALMPFFATGSEGSTVAWEAGGLLGFFVARRLLTLGPGGALVGEVSLLLIGLLLATPSLLGWLWRRCLAFLHLTPVDAESLVQDLEPLEADRASRTVISDYQDTLPELRIIGEDEPMDVLEEEDASVQALPPLRGYEQTETEDVEELEEEEPPKPKSRKKKKEKEVTELQPLEGMENLKIVTKEEETVFESDTGANLVETPGNETYELPPLSLLSVPSTTRPELAHDEILQNSSTLERTLSEFGISVKVVEVNYGPTITCYELEPAPGIKISRIENLANDITRALCACSVRIVAPIPGKGTVGVEVPNRHRSDVLLRDLLSSESYRDESSKLRIGLGKTISGEPYVFDLCKAPHLLVAGATGSGKSVCINSIIGSLLYNAAPHEVKLLLVDPKQVELALYRDIPHLLSPVVTDPRRAGAALRWAVDEMEQRYRYLKRATVRNITEYNTKRKRQLTGKQETTDAADLLPGFLPYIVVVIDELADLMMVARAEVEANISRLAAMARAVGIHLVLATQRPSVDVLTGVIKNNFPARIAFQVSAMADSRTILDMKGAESLMGRGDMLLSPGGAGRPTRVQGAFVSTEEIEDVVEFVKSQQEVDYVQEEFIPAEDEKPNSEFSQFDAGEDYDELYDQGVNIVLENDSASTSLLQRRMKIGYGRAARLLDLMEEKGIVGPPRGSKPRQIVLNRPV